MIQRVPAEVGQIYASTRPQDVARGWNQRRAVLRLDTKSVYRGFRGESRYEDRPVAVLTCDGNGGRMQSRVQLREDGSLPNHVLVSEPDPRIKALAETFRGIPTREPYGYSDRYADEVGGPKVTDLADEVYAALLWPRNQDGLQNPRIEVVLHQDALAAVGARILELARIVEQSALAATVGMEHVLMPAEREVVSQAANGVPEHMPELTPDDEWVPGNPADEGPEL